MRLGRLQFNRCKLLGISLTFVLLVSCNSQPDSSSTEEVEAARGGIYRVGVQSPFSFTAGFDPSGEYYQTAFNIYSNLLLRTLVGYRHVAGAAGNELVPDLATTVPEPTDDGLTYTFELKEGIEFGPPVSREITSQDVVYAMERIATPSVAAQYPFYYLSQIEGMQAYADGKSDSISGIETPDDRTIVFHLTSPAGDFPYRMAMPATSPIPPEVGECFEDAGEYGRYLVASGPYMIEGAPELDLSSCKSMKPLSGFDPDSRMILVRNPNYDSSTDSPEARESFPSEFHFLLNTNAKDIYDKIASAELESAIAQPLPAVIRRYSTDDAREGLMQRNFSDAVAYVNFVLTEPPFDDIHVRKAVNFVLDKDGLIRAAGGSLRSAIATHILPPTMTGGHPTAEEYDPYTSPDHRGDIDAAKDEMRQSRYDSNGDGICDADACEDILHFTQNVPPWTDFEPIIEESLGKVGITLETRELGDFFTAWGTISKSPPISSGAAWGKDYPDPYTYMGALFDSTAIRPVGNSNVPLVGITPELAQQYDVSGNVADVPSVNEDIAQCAGLTGPQRNECWVELDRKLMEDVVPWVPITWFYNIDILSPAVTNYEFDQFSGLTSFAHVAVDQSKQRGL